MTDVGATIAPKSDQLNSDDLIQGPRTITVTAVKAGDKEQPIAIYFQGDDGKPYKPCKGMRRVLVAFWGPDGSAYVGRSMTLFRNPKVKWGGIEVGGIQISHMTHLSADQTFSLTESKAKRSPFTVRKMDAPVTKQETPKPDPKPRGDITTVLALLTDPVTAPSLLAGYLEKQAWTKPERAQLQAQVDGLGKTTVDVGEDVP